MDFGQLSLKCKPEVRDSKKEPQSVETQDELNTIKEQSYWKFYLLLKNVQIKLANNENEFYSLRNVTESSDKHILTPLDIVLNLEKCAYSDDVNLPALIVVGELPLINLALTDQKLVHVLKILTNLDQNENIEVEEEHHFYLNQTNTENSLSSLNSEEDLEQSIKSINIIQSKIETRYESMKTSSVPLQNINIEFRFEIKDIVLTISEESKNKMYFNKILFRLSSIGALVQMKSYDIVGNIYLSYIALEYESKDSADDKLYLISSISNTSEFHNLETHIKNEKNRLIDIHLTQTDETSPTLSSMHNNVLCNVLIEFRSLNFIIDESAIGNVLRFLNGLNNALSRHLKSEKSATVAIKIAQPSQDTDYVKYNENQIHSLLNSQIYKSLDGDSLLAKQIVQYKITAKIDSIKMKLSNLSQKYFQVLIQTFETNIKKTKGLTELDVILTRISFQDIREDSLYREIIKLKDDGNYLIEFNLKFFEKHYLNKKVYLKSYLNENDFDLIITGKLSKLQCVFLYQHLSIVLVNFFRLNLF